MFGVCNVGGGWAGRLVYSWTLMGTWSQRLEFWPEYKGVRLIIVSRFRDNKFWGYIRDRTAEIWPGIRGCGSTARRLYVPNQDLQDVTAVSSDLRPLFR